MQICTVPLTEEAPPARYCLVCGSLALVAMHWSRFTQLLYAGHGYHLENR